ncbi:MAG: ABC transporter, substrate-binding protein (cluster 5, nickel/peptides/opines), partial [uncultured Chloroflexia bacterium]
MEDRHTTGSQDEPQADSPRTTRLISRRQFLRRASALTSVGAGLLTGCGAPQAAAPAPTTAAAPTTAPTEAAAPTIAPTEAAAVAPTVAATEAAAAPTVAATEAAAATAAPASSAGGGAITWAMENDPVQMLPFGSITTESFRARQMIYDSLVAWDKDLNVQPALAERYETPDDKTWIWHLRQGVKFHNGKEVDADDVKYSMDLQAAPPEPGIPSPFYPKTLTSVEVVDKYTVKFNMASADPTVLGYLAWGRYSPIVPKGLYEQVNVLTEGIGTGPFKLVEFVSNDRVVYTRNPDFWNPDLPHFDDMTLKVLPDESARVAALRSGEVHGCTVSADTAASLSNDPDITILSGLFAAPRVLQFTIKDNTKPWSNKQVRQAMSKAIDRQLIIENVYAGEAALTGPIAPGYGDWPLPDEELANTWFKYDPDAARQLMSDAGFADGFE